jgi:thiamine biosynthesis lipoprotein
VLVSDAHIETIPLMGTPVTIRVIGDRSDDQQQAARAEAIARAVGWFRVVESCCTRFDDESEIRHLTAQVGEPVPVTAMLFKVVHFAIALAAETNGAFDPTLGFGVRRRQSPSRAYPVHHVGRHSVETDIPGSYRDVCLDVNQQTIMLLRPLVLDLDAVAKGLAIDLAARELRPLEHFAIDAGRDMYLGGRGAGGGPWSVDLRHPRGERQAIETLEVSNMAMCTYGEDLPRALVSVTVVAPSAMVAIALATAAFALGSVDGLRLLEHYGVEGIIVSSSMDRFATAGISNGPLGDAGSSRAS